MLVLSRKSQESIVVDGGIVITILEVKGNRVRMGVSAPDDVRILRAELARQRPVANAACPPAVVGLARPPMPDSVER